MNTDTEIETTQEVTAVEQPPLEMNSTEITAPPFEPLSEESAATGAPTESEAPIAAPTHKANANEQIVWRNIFELRQHPYNALLYGETTIDETFLESVKEFGICTPLTITDDGNVVNGNRRLTAAQILKMPEVPVIVRTFADEFAEREALINANFQRVKTNLQITREFVALREIETEKARKRMSTKSTEENGRQDFSQAEFGKARDKAADYLGLSGVTLEKGARVVTQIDLYREAGKPEKADELLEALEQSFDAGIKLLFAGIRPDPGTTKRAATATTTPPDAGTENFGAPASTKHSVKKTTAKSIPAAVKTESDLAMESLDVLLSYLRKINLPKLGKSEKAKWKRALEPFVNIIDALSSKKSAA